jgi:hypothetical protein
VESTKGHDTSAARSAGGLEPLGHLGECWRRRGTAAGYRRVAIGDLRVVVDEEMQVFLVPGRGRTLEEPRKEVQGGLGSEPTDRANRAGASCHW